MISLIIAAHPDDEILGCGGTIAKYSSEQKFYVLFLTGGADGHYEKSFEKTLRDYAIKANQIIGTTEVFFESLPNQSLDAIPLTQVIQVIEKYIERIKPETLFIHAANDLNKDHRTIYEAGITAARPIQNLAVKKVYSYFVASSSEWNIEKGMFKPNIFVDIEGSLQKKSAAMGCYLSECRPDHPRSPEAITTYAAFWGFCSGLKFAEPFRLIQNISGEL
jgi:LmbE family N-acetylglucosaminyl deacetylase